MDPYFIETKSDTSRASKRPKISSRELDEAAALMDDIQSTIKEVSMQAEPSTGAPDLIQNEKAEVFMKTLRETKDAFDVTIFTELSQIRILYFSV